LGVLPRASFTLYTNGVRLDRHNEARSGEEFRTTHLQRIYMHVIPLDERRAHASRMLLGGGGGRAIPVRLRVIRELADGSERTGTALAERLGISLALLCHHTKILVGAGVVRKRKAAQTTFYKANTVVLAKSVRGF
jgi:DNA-binding transcriptional ArsR family regulator